MEERVEAIEASKEPGAKQTLMAGCQPRLPGGVLGVHHRSQLDDYLKVGTSVPLEAFFVI